MTKKIFILAIFLLSIILINGYGTDSDFILLNRTGPILDNIVDYSITKNKVTGDYYVNAVLTESAEEREETYIIYQTFMVDDKVETEQIPSSRYYRDYHVITFDSGWNRVDDKMYVTEGIKFNSSKSYYFIIGNDNSNNRVELYDLYHNLINTYDTTPDFITSDLHLIYINQKINRNSGFILIYDSDFNLVNSIDTYLSPDIEEEYIDITGNIVEKANKLYIYVGTDYEKTFYILDNKFKVLFKKITLRNTYKNSFKVADNGAFVFLVNDFDTYLNQNCYSVTYYNGELNLDYSFKFYGELDQYSIVKFSNNSIYFVLYLQKKDKFIVVNTLTKEKKEIHIPTQEDIYLGNLLYFKILDNGNIIAKAYADYSITYQRITPSSLLLIEPFQNKQLVLNATSSIIFEKIFANKHILSMGYKSLGNILEKEFLYYEIKNNVILGAFND